MVVVVVVRQFDQPELGVRFDWFDQVSQEADVRAWSLLKQTVFVCMSVLT